MQYKNIDNQELAKHISLTLFSGPTDYENIAEAFSLLEIYRDTYDKSIDVTAIELWNGIVIDRRTTNFLVSSKIAKQNAYKMFLEKTSVVL